MKNREIKIRAFLTEVEKMISAERIAGIMKQPINGKNEHDTILHYSDVEIDENGYCMEEETPDNYVLMQFTGLKDKNGKEIYEGDVVKVDYGVGKVEYSDNQGMFIITWIEDKEANNEALAYEPNSYKFGRTRTDLEVIGNIYETLTKQEAIAAMNKGVQVTHRYFTDDEWVKANQSGTVYILEDGVKCTPDEFWMWRKSEEWNKDWKLFS